MHSHISLAEFEQQKIQTLRNFAKPFISPRLNDDSTLLRWLRQNNFDMAITVDRLKSHMDFRRLLDLDREDPTTFELNAVFEKTWALYLTGTKDRFGSPIAFRLIGLADIQGMMKCSKERPFI